jgi:hypothetical protein
LNIIKLYYPLVSVVAKQFSIFALFLTCRKKEVLEATKHQAWQRFWHDQPWSSFSSFVQDQGASQPSVLVLGDHGKRIPSLELTHKARNSCQKQ